MAHARHGAPRAQRQGARIITWGSFLVKDQGGGKEGTIPEPGGEGWWRGTHGDGATARGETVKRGKED